ncbi:MAG: hypothetical protein ACOCM4_07795 [Acetivibrio ethanolgignens]
MQKELFGKSPGSGQMVRLTFANAAASIITTRKGALRVMPERKEIEQLM